jgi:galactokinase
MAPPNSLENDAIALFKRHFGFTPAHTVRVPGRLELLGNHTDYNGGLVLSVAVDRYLHLACAPRMDGRIELVSSLLPQSETFWMSEIKRNPAAPWTDPVKGVLVQLRKRGVPFSGFNAAIHNTIPVGAGMSANATLEVATALAVRKLHPFSLTDHGAASPPKRNERGELPSLTAAEQLHFANLCRMAETEFVGVPGGMADPVSSLSGKAWHALGLDCQHLTVEHAPLIGEIIIVCNPGVQPPPGDERGNELRAHCESAARKLGAKFLRTVDMKHLLANRKHLTAREFECARHVVSEIARVVAGERALRTDDHRQFGQFMFQSHQSSRYFLKNSCRELDALVDIARLQPGCRGARLTGTGFGGATINLVAHHQAEDFMQTVAQRYAERTGQNIQPLICQMVDGAGWTPRH